MSPPSLPGIPDTILATTRQVEWQWRSFFCLVVQAVTGLVLAGTDILYPPFGSWIAHWIAAPNVDPSALTPLTRNLMNQDAYAVMRSFRAPFVEVHELAFYGIAVVVVLHVIAVIVTE